MIAVSVFLLAGMLAWVGIPLSSSADTAQYFYDPLGRLVGVVDGQGNIATYNYDAVGNLLSISRGAVTAPTVTAVSPSTIEAGRTITMTLTGTGFLGSSVSFPNPDVIPSNLTVTDTTITMNVFVRNPTTFGQNVVTVRNLGGEASGTFGLTQPQLVITSVSPREGEPGAVVVITGTGFGMKLGSNDVAFSGAGNARIAGVVLSYGFTRVTVQAPVAITRGPLTVEVGGVVSNAVTFTGPPILSAISTTAGQGLPENPAAASANLAQTVQLFGAGFWTNTRVRFSATSPTGVSETAFGSLFNVSQDGTSASVSVPSRTTTGTVTVQDAHLSTIYPGVFLQIVPTMDGLSVPPGQPLLPGTVATLSGSGFKASATSVTFSGAAAPVSPTAILSNNDQLTVTAPVGVTAGPLSVRTDGGVSLPFAIPSVTALAAIASVGTAANAGVSSSNPLQTIQLQGTGLKVGMIVYFSTTDLTGAAGFVSASVATAALDGTSATILVPATATTGNVTINGVGSVLLQVVPTVTAATLAAGSSFSPNTVMTIRGTGFKEGTTSVFFSGAAGPVPATDVFPGELGNDRLTVTIPSGADGASFAIITDGGTSATRQFGVLQSITAIAPRGTPQNPAQPSANVGQSIALQGVGFGPGSQAIFTSTSDTGTAGFVAGPLINVNPAGTSANVIVPATATSGPVSVDGQGSVSLQIVPTVFTLMLPSGQIFAPGVVATLGGTGFKEGATMVTFSGAGQAAASDVTNNNSRLTVTIPTGAIAGTITVIADGNIGVFDTTRPSVRLVLPSNGQQNASLNTRITVFFDEPVQPATVTNTSLFVTGPSGLVPGTVTLSSVQQTAIFTPAQSLEATNGYAVSFTTAITDLAGNALNPGATTFSTGTLSDSTAPTVTNTSPLSGASAVPTNTVVRVYFSESLLNTTVSPQSVTLSVAGVPVPTSAMLEQNNTVLRLQASAPLQANVAYTVTVAPTVADLAGNAFGAQFTSTFSTGAGSDTTVPTVSTRTPADGATNVPLDTTLVVTFTEAIEPATVDSTSTFTLTGGGISGTIPGVFSFSPDRLTVTFTPLFPLFAGQTFFLTLSGVEDMSGNRLGEAASSFSIQAGTGGGVIPAFATVIPAPNALFANGKTITRVTIDNIADSNGFLVPDGTQIAVTAAPAFQQTSVGGTILGGTISTADPRFKIFATTNGRVRFDYQSPALVLAPGFSANGIVQVTSVTATGIPIGMIGSSPVTLVTSQTATISINPQELLPNGTSQAEIRVAVRDPINTLDDFGRPIPAGTTMGVGVLSPAGPLGTINGGTAAPDPRYKIFSSKTGGILDVIYTAPNLVQGPGEQTSESFSAVPLDLAGNGLGALGFGSLVLRTGGCAGSECVAGGFTGPLPTLAAQSPGSGEDNVGTTAPVLAQFSQSIDPASVTALTFVVSSGGTPIPGSYTVGAGPKGPNTSVIFTPSAPWTAGTVVDVTVTTGIKNSTGNPLLASAFNSFSIGAGPDISGPTVVNASLGNGLTGVPHSAVINMQFNQPVNAVTLNSANVTVLAGGVPITGRISLSNGEFGVNTIATFIQDQLLASDTLYTITVGAGVTDSSGNALAPVFTSTFRTATGTPITDVGQPSVVSVNPPNNQQEVPLNPVIALHADKAINPITLTSGFSVTASGVFGAIQGTTAFAADQAGWTFSPVAPLSSTRLHTVRVTNSVRDIAGNRLANGLNSTFVTGTTLANPAGPQMDSMTPLNNATNVPLNQPSTIRFMEPIAAASVTAQTVFVSRNGAPVSGVLTLLENSRAIRWVPANAGTLSPNSVHTMTVTTGVTGLSANPLTAPLTFSFTTGTATDTTSPAVTSFTPLNGTQDVPRTQQVQVTFNEPIDPASAQGGFFLEHADTGATIVGAPTLLPDRTVIQFVPAFPLFAGQNFSIVLNGITDSVGNQMAFANSTFTTALAPGTIVSNVPDSANVSASPTNLIADGQETSAVTITGVSRGGVPVPDGTLIGVTTSPAFRIDSFPGTLLGGAPSGTDSRFVLYPVVGGSVTLTYQTPALSASTNRESYVQVVGVDAAGAPMSLIGEKQLRLFGTGGGQ